MTWHLHASRPVGAPPALHGAARRSCPEAGAQALLAASSPPRGDRRTDRAHFLCSSRHHGDTVIIGSRYPRVPTHRYQATVARPSCAGHGRLRHSLCSSRPNESRRVSGPCESSGPGTRFCRAPLLTGPLGGWGGLGTALSTVESSLPFLSEPEPSMAGLLSPHGTLRTLRLGGRRNLPVATQCVSDRARIAAGGLRGSSHQKPTSLWAGQ